MKNLAQNLRFPSPPAPNSECGLCPRLVEFRQVNRLALPGGHNAPVPSFGGPDASLLILGLAPGLHGANATGRPFTGDWAGDMLYPTLIRFGFADGIYEERADDGLQLRNCRISNSVRCVPPQNKPTPAEIAECRPFLAASVAALPRLRAVLALGRIAHDSVLKTFGRRLSATPFTHGVRHDLGAGLPALFDSYHCSRYNTNTGVLTPDMFRSVIADIRAYLA